MRTLRIFFRSILLVVTFLMIAVYTQAQSESAVSHNELAQEQEQEKTLRGKELHLTEAENPLTKAERAWLKEHPRVRVAIMNNWPPLNFVNDKGMPEGIGVNYFRLLQKRIDVDFEIVPGIFADNIQAVKEKRIDVLMDVNPLVDREKYLHFTQPYLTIPHVIVARINGPYYENEKTLIGKTVVLERGSSIAQYFRENFPSVKVAEHKDTVSCLQAVAKGEADAYVGNRVVAAYFKAMEVLYTLQIQGSFSARESILALGVRKDWPEFAGILDKALDSLSYEEQKGILQRWVDRAEQVLGINLKQNEKTWLYRNRNIRLGVDPAWMPFEGIGPEGQYEGMSSEYVSWLNDKLNTAMVPVYGLSWSEVMERAKSGQIDVLPAATPTPERRKFLNFTRPYVSIPMVLINAEKTPFINGLDDLQGKRVAVVKGYASEEYLKTNHPTINVVSVSNLKRALNAVLAGKADAVLDNMASITYTIRLNDLSGLKIAATTQYTFNLALGVRKDWPEFIDILDRALMTIPDSTKRSFYDRWVNIQVQSRVDWKYVWRVGMGTSAVVLLILSVILRWNRKLAHEVDRRRHVEERTRLILDSAGDGIFGVNQDDCVTFINDAAATMLGYNIDELIGSQVHTKIHHSHQDGTPYSEVECPMNKAFTSGSTNTVTDEVLWRKDGTSFPVEYSATPLFSEDRVSGAVVVFRDVSERKAGEDALRQSEERYALVVTGANDGIWDWNVETDEFYFSPRYMEMLGYGPNEFPHQFENITKLIDHNDLEHLLHNDIRPCLEGDKDDYEVEYRMRHKDGKWLWILSRGVTVKNDTGKVVRVAGTHSDITERKRMEEALSAERERLQGILDNSPVGIAFSTKRIIRFANPMFRKMFGIDIGDSALDMYVAPEERDKLIEKLKAEGKVENYELQLYGRGGDIRDILITYLPIQYEGEDGVLGWLLDISDRKRAELEIREKYDELARFRRLAVGREKKMIELKREINELLKSSGLPKKYKIH